MAKEWPAGLLLRVPYYCAVKREQMIETDMYGASPNFEATSEGKKMEEESRMSLCPNRC